MSLRTSSGITCWVLICAGTVATACTRSKQYDGADDGATGAAGDPGFTASATGAGGSANGGGNSTAGSTGNTTMAVASSGGTSSGGTNSGGTNSGGTDSDTSSGDAGAGGDPGSGGDGGSGGVGGSGGGTSDSGGSEATSSGGSMTTGGSGGGNTSDDPELGAACDDPGALGCNGSAQKLRLICEEGVWKNNGSCNANENCEQTSGVCAPIDVRCDGLAVGGRYCDDKTVRECGPDRVNSEAVEECSAACVVYESHGQCATVTHVAAGRHTCAVLSTGQLRCWGYNGSGQLGYGHTENLGDQEFEMPPPDVPLGAKVLQVAVAELSSHTCAILETGAVRCWGHNDAGQLGLGHTDDVGSTSAPSEDVPLEERATQVVTGSSHTCALLESGNVRCWGSGVALGLPAAAGSVGDNETPSQNVPLGGKAVQIASGAQHTCARLESGAVRCWGSSADGQLGLPGASSLDSEVRPTIDVALSGGAEFISAGGYSSCAIRELLYGNRAFFCWGNNFHYQLGNGTDEYVGRDAGDMPPSETPIGATAVQAGVSSYNGCALTSSGVVRCWGQADYAGYGMDGYVASSKRNGAPAGDLVGDIPPDDVPIGAPVVTISVGQGVTCAILQQGTLRCWGENASGQLGYGNIEFVGDDETPEDMGDVPVF